MQQKQLRIKTVRKQVSELTEYMLSFDNESPVFLSDSLKVNTYGALRY